MLSRHVQGCQLILFCSWRKKTTESVVQVVHPPLNIQSDIVLEDPHCQVCRTLPKNCLILLIRYSCPPDGPAGKLQFKLGHEPRKFLRLRLPAGYPGSNGGLSDHRRGISRSNFYSSRNTLCLSRRTPRMRSRLQ